MTYLKSYENISTIATMRDALMETVGCVVIDFAKCPPKYKINNTLNKENNFVSLYPSSYKFWLPDIYSLSFSFIFDVSMVMGLVPGSYLQYYNWQGSLVRHLLWA